MNESFKTDPSLATSARAANESGSYLCASNVTPTAVRFIVSVFLCLLCSCRMSSTQMTCSHFRKNRPKKRQKPAGCRSRIISKNRPVPIFGRSTGASLRFNLVKCWCTFSSMPLSFWSLRAFLKRISQFLSTNKAQVQQHFTVSFTHPLAFAEANAAKSDSFSVQMSLWRDHFPLS